MLIRYVGPYEDGSVFAVLLINAAWPVIDPFIEKHLVSSNKNKKEKPNRKERKKIKKSFLKKEKEAEING